MIKKILILFVSIIIFSHSASGKNQVIKITSDEIHAISLQYSNTMTLKGYQSASDLIRETKLNHSIFIDTSLSIPVYGEILGLNSSRYSIQIDNEQWKDITSLTDKELKSTIEQWIAQWQGIPVRIGKLGRSRGVQLGMLQIFPFRKMNDKIQILTNADIDIRFDHVKSVPTGAIGEDGSIIPTLNKRVISYNTNPVNTLNKTTSIASQLYGNALRIYTRDEGIYKITYQDLVDNRIDPARVDFNQLKLLNQGKEVAFFASGDEDGVFDREDYVEFWAEPLLNNSQENTSLYYYPFSAGNVYLLVWGNGNGIRMVEEPGGLSEQNPLNYNPSTYFRYTEHIEENTFFDRLGYFNTNRLTHLTDSWFMDNGVTAPERKSYEFEAIYPDSSSFDPIHVVAILQGRSPGGQHKVQLWLNNQFVGETSGFAGQQYKKMESDPAVQVYSSHLRHGSNILDMQLLKEFAGSGADIVALNWFEVSYDRQYRAHNNTLRFTIPSFKYFPEKNLYQFELKNFTTPKIDIYKKGVSKIVGYSVEATGEGDNTRYTIKFQDRLLTTDVQYIALTEDNKKHPEKIEWMEPIDVLSVNGNLRNPANRADYIIITHANFYNRAKELVGILEQTGHEIELVDVQNIYDEFNNSIKSPVAIKNFLKYAYTNWDQNTKLKYVLLLGDATMDPAEYVIRNKDFVPAFFYQTYKFGAVPSDYEYSLLDGDDLIPDIAVGRVPVSLSSELIQYITKVSTFLAQESGSWTNKAIFISGNDAGTYEINDPKSPAFRSQNQRLIDLSTPRTLTTYKLNTVKDPSLDFDPNFGSTTDLINYMDEGVAFINFVGHGGGGIWADVSLMDLTDVDLLSNDGKFPFISSLTCFTGAFENYNRYGLGEKMLLEEDKGCIAFFGSAGLGWLHNDFTMGWKVPEYVLNQNMPFGDAVNLTKIYYLSSYLYPGSDTLTTTPGYGFLSTIMVHQYNLLGDPTLKLPLAKRELTVEVMDSWIEPGDTVHIRISGLSSTASGYYEISDYRNQPMIQLPLTYPGSEMVLNIPIPTDFPENEAFVRVYLESNDEGYCGVANFAVNEPYLSSISLLPENPVPADTVRLKLQLSNSEAVDSLRIKWLTLNSHKLIHVNRVGDSEYISDPILLSDDQFEYFYSVYLYLQNGTVRKYINRKLKVEDTRPELAVGLKNYKFVLKNDSLFFRYFIYNNSLNGSTSDTVRFYVGRTEFQQNNPFLTDQISVAANDSAMINVYVDDYRTWQGETLYSTVAGESIDKNMANNTDSVTFVLNAAYLIPQLGISYDKNQTAVIQLDSTVTISSTAEFDSIGAIFYQMVDIDQFTRNLTEIEPVSIVNFAGKGLNIKIEGTKVDTQLALSFKYDPAIVEQNNRDHSGIRIFRWNAAINQWLGMNSVVDSVNSSVVLKNVKDGLYAMFYSTDVTPPNIEFTVDGRPLLSRAIVSNNPKISVFIEDVNGVQLDKSLIQIYLNDKPVPSNYVYLPDSISNPSNLGIRIYPELETGEHILTVQVRDINGNLSEKTVSMLVEQEFSIHVFGNYPNPFTDKTIFSYYITNSEVIDDLEVRIYTISGRLIRKLTEDENTINVINGARQLGYNELIWDGKDEDGNDVANGVYFALFRAKYQGKVKEKIIKVARLR